MTEAVAAADRSAAPARITPAGPGLLVAAAGRRILPLLLLVALVKGLVWSLLLPPWYGPDEPSHFMYTQLLAEEGRVPAYAPGRADGRDTPSEVFCSEQNLGWRLNGPFYAEPVWGVDPHRCPTAAVPNRGSRVPDIPTNPAGGYSPLSYALGVPFYVATRDLGVDTRVHAVRLLSVLLGVAATWFMYLGAGWAFRRRPHLALAATAVFLFQPMASQQFAVVNNDALLIAAAAFFFWRFFRSLWVPLSSADATWLGFAVGLAYLAKPQGVLLAALLPIVLWPEWRRGTGLRRLAVLTAIAGGVLAVTFAAGAVTNIALHGTVLPQGAVVGTQRFSALGYFQDQFGAHFSRFHWLWITSAWGFFGWFSTSLPLAAFEVIVGVELLAAIGLVAALRRGRERRVVVAAVLGVGITWILTQSLEVYYFRRGGELILQGRSFLPLLPAGAIAITAGIAGLLPAHWRRHAAAALVAAALALNLFSLMVLLEAFFG